MMADSLPRGNHLEHVDHVLAPVLRIANKPLLNWINNEVEALKWYLANEHRAVVGNFGHVTGKFSSLHGQLDGAIEFRLNDSSNSTHRSRTKWRECQLTDKPLGNREHHCAGINQRIFYFNTADLVTREFTTRLPQQVFQILHESGNRHFAHRDNLHSR